MFDLPLKPGDRVIASFPFRDQVLVITQWGHVWQIKVEEDPMAGCEIRLVVT